MRIFLFLTLLLPALVALAVERPNLVQNGDFEGGMAGWAGNGAVSADAVHHGGAQALLLSAGPKSGANVAGPKVPVQGGHDYLLDFFMRSEGFSRKKGDYDGVSASFTLYFLDAAGKQVGSIGGGLPYGAQPNWIARVRLCTAPAAAVTAQFTCGMSVGEASLPSKLWLDDLQLRLWDGVVKPGGKTWTFVIGDGYFGRALFRRAADDDAGGGFAVIANLRFNTTPGYLAGGMYFKGFPPGTYRALYRMKIAELPEKPVAAVNLDANPQNGGGTNERTVPSSEFTKAGVYQDVPLRFVIGPETGYMDLRAYWPGNVTAWIDTITVVEEELK